MAYLVKSKEININKKEIKQDSLGNFYSGDRFYTLLNQYIDENLTRKSRTLAFIIKYLFKSSNYKHDPQIANGRSIGVLIVDIIAILSIIGFFAMIISVIGLSFKSIPTNVDVSGIAAFGKGFIESISGNIVMLVFAIIFFVISIAWLWMYFKIRRKNAKLSLKDYVIKKIEMCLKWRFLIKATNATTSSIKNVVNYKKDFKVVCLEMFETQGGSGDRWLNIQMINLLASIFNDFNLVFQFNTLSDDEYNELNHIFEVDFKKLELLQIK